MKKKLKEFALVAEIISALAVVAGLIFVGLEISQSTDQAMLNTRAVEVAAYQDLIGQIIEINRDAMKDPELLDIIIRGSANQIDPSETIENQRYFRFIVINARHADLACFQYEQGLISLERLASALAVFRAQVDLNQPQFLFLESGTPGLRDCVELTLQ
jgi:hypothetical protein